MNIRSIAKEANVSPATVSLVLNSKPGVNKDTRARVTKLLIENGYQIRASTSKQYNTKELLFLRFKSDSSRLESRDDFLVQIMEGAEAQATDYGYRLSFSSVERHTLPEILATAAQNYAGIIVFGTELDEQDAAILSQASIPLSVTDASFPLYPIHTVSINNYGAIYHALRYLNEMGHTQIGYLHSTVQSGEIPDRMMAYRNAMQLLQLEQDPRFVYSLDPFLNLAYQQMCATLNQNPELPTAFIADNDMLALGAMQAFQQNGYRVPDDISLIGFDDSHMSGMSSPPLTTIRVPKQMMGRVAVRQIKYLLDEPDDCEIYKTQICAEIVERRSVMRSLHFVDMQK